MQKRPSFYISALIPVVTLAGSCDKGAIRSCLVPPVNYLRDNSDIGNTKKGLFLTSLGNYMRTLQDGQEDFIHVSSLDTILTKIDSALLRPLQLQHACG